MSDILLLNPILPFAAFSENTEDEWPASGFIGFSAPPQTHVALYEWIRRFVEDQCDAVELQRAETALRELICLDESRMRTDCLERWHLFALRADMQRREAALSATEALSRYALYRLVHCGNRSAKRSGGERAGAAELLREMRELFDAAEAPAAARAMAAERAAAERLRAVSHALEHQTAQMEKMQSEMNDACRALNELAEYAGVGARCEEKFSGAAAAESSPVDVVEALRFVIRKSRDVSPNAYAADCASCARLRSDNVQLQCQVLELQDQLRDQQQGRHYTQQTCSQPSAAASSASANGTRLFDPLTVALHRLEEARAHSYALEALSGERVHTNSLRRSDTESRLSHAGPSYDCVSLESMRYEEHLSVVHELREIVRLVGQLPGVRSVFLRRGATECAAFNALSVFPAHGISLHQWSSPESLRPVRCAAVLYALPPSRAVNMPRAEINDAAAAGKINVIDLSGGAALGGDAVRFSADGSFVYVCAGNAMSTPAERAELRDAANALCTALRISPDCCFVYFDAARSGKRRLGWAGEGICAWALNEMFFEPPRERQRFEAHLNKTYRVVLSLSNEEVNAFAGDCVEIVVRSLNHASVARRLIISQQAQCALSAENRERMCEWYGATGCLVPNLTTIERTGGHSAGSVVLTVITHGAKVPPPPTCGFLAISGIGRRDA